MVLMYAPGVLPSTLRVFTAEPALPFTMVVDSPRMVSADEVALTSTLALAPVATVVITILLAVNVTLTPPPPVKAAVKIVSISAVVTASMSEMPAVLAPDTCAVAKPSAVLAVPPVTSILDPVPLRSEVMVTLVPLLVTVAVAPTISLLMACATSSAVAAPMSTNSAVSKVMVCAVVSASTLTVKVCWSTST